VMPSTSARENARYRGGIRKSLRSAPARLLLSVQVGGYEIITAYTPPLTLNKISGRNWELQPYG